MPVIFYSRSIHQKRAIGRRTMDGGYLCALTMGGLMCWSYKQSALPWSIKLLW